MTSHSLNVGVHVLRMLQARTDLEVLQRDAKRVVCGAELRERIQKRMQSFWGQGMRAGDRVVLQVPPGEELAINAIAVLALGGVLVIAEAGMADDIYNGRIRTVGAKWCVVSPLVFGLQRIPGLRRLVIRRGIPLPPALDDVTTLVCGRDSRGGTFELPTSHAADLAVVIFTGGTTSEPKGVGLSHGALGAYLKNIEGLMHGHDIERFVADTPQQILFALYLGRSVWIPKGRGAKRFQGMANYLSQGRGQMLFGPPSTWVELLALVRNGKAALPKGLKLVLLGGAPVSDRLLHEVSKAVGPQAHVGVLYGLSEAGPVCTTSAAARARWQGEGNLVGAPLPGVRLNILEPKGPLSVGEVLVSSDALYSGYVGRKNVDLEFDGRRYLRTGDLGRMVAIDGEENLVLMGRLKDMLVRKGLNIYPPSVEPLVEALQDSDGSPMVDECAIVGLWDDQAQDERMVLCYVAALDRQAAGDIVSEKDLLPRLKEAVGPQLQPDAIASLAHLPRTGRQRKVDKNRLRQMMSERFGWQAEVPLSRHDHHAQRP